MQEGGKNARQKIQGANMRYKETVTQRKHVRYEVILLKGNVRQTKSEMCDM